MAKPIDLKTLSEEERGVLVESVPLLRKTSKEYYWEEPEFKRLYSKWLDVTKSAYVDGGFAQFKLAIHQMRNKTPLTYKVTKEVQNVRTS